MCEYVGVKMKHTQLPEKSREILVVHTQLSVQTCLSLSLLFCTGFLSIPAFARGEKLQALWCFEKQVFGLLSA